MHTHTHTNTHTNTQTHSHTAVYTYAHNLNKQCCIWLYVVGYPHVLETWKMEHKLILRLIVMMLFSRLGRIGLLFTNKENTPWKQLCLCISLLVVDKPSVVQQIYTSYLPTASRLHAYLEWYECHIFLLYNSLSIIIEVNVACVYVLNIFMINVRTISTYIPCKSNVL